MAKVSNIVFADKAYKYHDKQIPYSTLDCQAFVERVLHDCGINANWRGSNDMWRNAGTWQGTIEEAEKAFGDLPVGVLLYTIKHDGKEDKNRYKDGINAAHVGIYTGLGKGAMHSTTGGVQECAFPDPKRWTHCQLCKYVDYSGTDYKETIKKAIELLKTLL